MDELEKWAFRSDILDHLTNSRNGALMNQPQEVIVTLPTKQLGQIFGIIVIGNLVSFTIVGALGIWGKRNQEKKAQTNKENHVKL